MPAAGPLMPPSQTAAVRSIATPSSMIGPRYEARVIAAMQNSMFLLCCVLRRHATAGVMLADLLHASAVWLIDALEASAQPGTGLALRVATPDRFAISCGAIVPFGSDMLKMLPPYRAASHIPAKVTLSALPDDGPLARAVYPVAPETGFTDQARYQ